MSTPIDDTEVQFRGMLRQLGPSDRVAMACRMFSTGRALAIAGLLSRDRGLTGFSLKRALLRHVYGRDLTSDQLSAIEIALRQPNKQMHPPAATPPEDHDV